MLPATLTIGEIIFLKQNSNHFLQRTSFLYMILETKND